MKEIKIQDIVGIFLTTIFTLIIWIITIIIGPFIFCWAINIVANTSLLVINSFMDWLAITIIFLITGTAKISVSRSE